MHPKRSHILFTTIALLLAASLFGQTAYRDSTTKARAKYVKEHEVVKGSDKKAMQFFAPDTNFRVIATFERIYDAPWFKMATSGKEKKVYRVYGIVHFTLHDTTLKLNVYQSQQLMDIKKYEDHLFIPFTDRTSGEETYDNGRYIDMEIDDFLTGTYTLDFNQAYNPYCAYITGEFNCPVPPAENDLPIAIRAGEKKFAKVH